MINKKILVLAIVLALFASGVILAKDAPSSGTFSVLYDVEGLTADFPDTVPATVTGNGISGLSLSRGPGIGGYELKNGFSANNWALSDPTLEGAIASGNYFEFGISVDPGFTASLETLDLFLRRSALHAPMYFELQASLNNFASPGITVASFRYHGRTSGSAPQSDPLGNDPYYYMHSDLAGRPNTATSPGDRIPTVDLTSFQEFKNMPGGTTVAFRLYAWGNESTTATNTVALGRMQGPIISGIFEYASN